MKKSLKALLSSGLLFGCATTAMADGETTVHSSERLLIIYDSSNSMWGELSDKARKLEAGRSAVEKLIGSGFQGRPIGFRAYGHRRQKDCRDSELIVGFSPAESAGAKIKSTVNRITPKGKTPITYSLQQGLSDLEGAGDILLVTDGIETCDADPCALMKEWQKTKVGIRVHVLGVGLNAKERAGISCIADISGGKFVDAQSAEQFAEGLKEVKEAAVDVVPEPQASEEVVVAPEPEGVEEGGPETFISFVYPNGETFTRDTELWQDGQAGYNSNGINPLAAPAGTYEVRSDDVLTPLTPLEITITGEGETIVLPVDAGFLSVSYGGDPKDYLTTPDRYFITPLPNGDRVLASLGEAVPVKPGSYKITAWDKVGFFQPVTLSVENGSSISATLEPAGLSDVTIRYVTSEHYLTKPDRVFLKPLEGQELKQSYTRPGEVRKVLPGKYEVTGWTSAGYFDPIEVIVEPGTPLEVEIAPKALGELIVTYAPSDAYSRTPDRARAKPLDGQQGLKGPLKPDEAKKALPGRYKIIGWNKLGEFEPLEAEVIAGETTTVTLQLKTSE